MTEPAPTPEREPEVRYLPVRVEPQPVEAQAPRAIQPALPVAPPAAVAAAGGFLAGVATFFLARMLRRRDVLAFRRALGGRRRGGVEIAGSRSFLVDIHLLRR